MSKFKLGEDCIAIGLNMGVNKATIVKVGRVDCRNGELCDYEILVPNVFDSVTQNWIWAAKEKDLRKIDKPGTMSWDEIKEKVKYGTEIHEF